MFLAIQLVLFPMTMSWVIISETEKIKENYNKDSLRYKFQPRTAWRGYILAQTIAVVGIGVFFVALDVIFVKIFG